MASLTKDQLRKQTKKELNSIIQWSPDHLIEWLKLSQGTWGIYSALKGEMDTQVVMENAKLRHLNWALPRWQNAELWFESESIRLNPDQLTGLLIPALLIDECGYRLGRGGGHYDRFLVGFKGRRIGLVPEKRFVKSLPKESFDQRLEAVATESALVWLSKCD